MSHFAHSCFSIASDVFDMIGKNPNRLNRDLPPESSNEDSDGEYDVEEDSTIDSINTSKSLNQSLNENSIDCLTRKLDKL